MSNVFLSIFFLSVNVKALFTKKEPSESFGKLYLIISVYKNIFFNDCLKKSLNFMTTLVSEVEFQSSSRMVQYFGHILIRPYTLLEHFVRHDTLRESFYLLF